METVIPTTAHDWVSALEVGSAILSRHGAMSTVDDWDGPDTGIMDDVDTGPNAIGTVYRIDRDGFAVAFEQGVTCIITADELRNPAEGYAPVDEAWLVYSPTEAAKPNPWPTSDEYGYWCAARGQWTIRSRATRFPSYKTTPAGVAMPGADHAHLLWVPSRDKE
jgi:hypothetical protein